MSRLQDDHNYILIGKTPFPEPDVLAWGRWFQTANRTVAYTDIRMATSNRRVSTVFLATNYNFGLGEPHDLPILFETMVFTDDKNDPWDSFTKRYASWWDAELGHKAIVKAIKKGQLPND